MSGGTNGSTSTNNNNTNVKDFVFGADLSYANAIDDHGGKYMDSSQVKDVYKIFKSHGANLIRLGLWINPSWQANLNGGKIFNDFDDLVRRIRHSKENDMMVDQYLHFSDISFLPQLEDRGIKFKVKGIAKDVIEILKDHGLNYVRLRIFNNPARDNGYAPGIGYCDLLHTKAMAKRIKASGLKLLLDFHYSDTWADPGKQWAPTAWRGQSILSLASSLHEYTKRYITGYGADRK